LGSGVVPTLSVLEGVTLSLAAVTAGLAPFAAIGLANWLLAPFPCPTEGSHVIGSAHVILGPENAGSSDPTVCAKTRARPTFYVGLRAIAHGRVMIESYVSIRDVQVYSITLVASASNDGGIVRPSAFAVLRLITNSNFVDTKTGRSVGFSPLRMRPT
jgi:hypothetical protein